MLQALVSLQMLLGYSHFFMEIGEADTHENRYLQLMTKMIRADVKTKVLMLSAMKFADLIILS
ncbi:MAG: hypothetical protein K2N05_12125 [Muribaculaceae bacterium]|nr:hypothetical protein [Muribaculaceae bacterium]